MNPSDELGEINRQLRDDLWREAAAARAELNEQLRSYKRPDQLAYSALIVAGLALIGAAGLVTGAIVAWVEHFVRR